MNYLEDCKYRDVKWDDLVNDYGCVKDLDFAKYLIKLMWDKRKYHVAYGPSHQEFLDRVQNELFQYEEDEFTFYNDDSVNLDGSPGGYSGIIFQEFSQEAAELSDGYGFEDIMNDADKVICVVENQPRLFIVHEMD